MEPYGIIYLLIDGTNDLEYVGQTIRSAEARFREHKHGDTYVDRAIRAHGADMFVTAVLKVCYSKAELDFWEKHFIKYRDTKVPNGYNCTDGGDGGIPGFSHTAETRAKISEAHKGKEVSDETRKKISAANTGKKRTDEERAKMSEARTGDKNHFFNKHHKDETCLMISFMRRGESPYKNLLAEMDKRQISYAGLAKILKTSRRTVSDKLRGRCKFTKKEVAKLVEFFGMPAEYLLERDDGETAVTKKCQTPYKNLLAEMEKRQLSYKELSKLLGYQPNSLSPKMRGEENFTSTDAAKLEEIFGMPATYLLARDDGLSAILSREEWSAKISVARRTETPYKNLLAEMDKRQLTYTALAELMGIAQVTFSDKLRDKQKFTLKNAAKLEEIFGLPATYLLERDDGETALSTRGESPYKNLLAEMEKRQMSHATLAELLSLSRPSVSEKMRGKKKFSERDKAKLVEIFGKPIEYLLARDD